MIENIKLSIVSRQAASGGKEFDSIVEDHQGTIAQRDGVLFVRWETDEVKNLMKITAENRIELIRSGAIVSRMSFEKGCTDRSSYKTSAGIMELETKTNELIFEGFCPDIDMHDICLCIHLSYELIVGGECVSENDMLMRILST